MRVHVGLGLVGCKERDELEKASLVEGIGVGTLGRDTRDERVVEVTFELCQLEKRGRSQMWTYMNSQNWS